MPCTLETKSSLPPFEDFVPLRLKGPRPGTYPDWTHVSDQRLFVFLSEQDLLWVVVVVKVLPLLRRNELEMGASFPRGGREVLEGHKKCLEKYQQRKKQVMALEP